MEGYGIGQTPPGLAEDGSFESALNVRVHSIVDDDGKILVVDKETGVLIEDSASSDDDK